MGAAEPEFLLEPFHYSGWGTPARVHGGTRAPMQPLGATGAHADLWVIPEPGQILLDERRPAAPADRALNLSRRNRNSRHGCILPPDGTIREHRGSVRTTGPQSDGWMR